MKLKWIIPLILGGSLSLFSCKTERKQEAREPYVRKSGKTLLMHYMPWYETPSVRGRWGAHWTGHESQHKPGQTNAKGLPDIWSHFHPLAGLYDSTDADVLECQLLQMKIAGVDGVIVDWYGLGKVADYPSNHQATQAMFEAAGKQLMKFAVCYEDRSIQYMEQLKVLKAEDVQPHLTDMFRWMHGEWFQKEQYFRIGGRPLVLNFGPMHVRDAATWSSALGSLPERPAFYALHHLWKNAGADGGFMWVNQTVWQGSPDEETIRQRLQKEYDHASPDSAKLIVAAYPGFKDVYAQSHPVLEHRDGATMRESLRTCMRGPWEVVQLVTWNDYGEGTVIEPTHEFGYRFLEVIQEERRLELGAEFPYQAEDLKLPASLLQIRRNPAVPREAGDKIAAMLRQGDTTGARSEISRLNHQ